MTFEYTPLADASKQIRTVLLQPGTWDDDIRISFNLREIETTHTAWLEHDHQTTYEALSYAWGSQADKVHISVDSSGSETLAITRNLEIALRHLRHKDIPRLLWADALCIDQESVEEKNKQVAIMGQVYARASMVIVWVGAERDDSDVALSCFQYLSDQVRFENNLLYPTDSCPKEDYHLSDQRALLPFQNRQFIAIESFFERPYFKRTWVRQEIARSADAVLYCGSQTLAWDTFAIAAICIALKPMDDEIALKEPETFGHLCTRLWQLCQAITDSYDYATIRRDLGETECHDPRDKIYAALCMINRHEPELSVEPDYSSPVEKVYADFARRVIEGKRNLDLFASCVLSARVLNIPSWVPDWSVPLPPAGPIRSCWHASAWISSHTTFVSDETINVKGLSVARVTAVSPLEPRLYAHTYNRIRSFKQVPMGLIMDQNPRSDWAEIVALTMFCQEAMEDFQPPRTNMLGMSEFTELLRKIWSSEKEWDELDREERRSLWSFLDLWHEPWRGLHLFEADNGSIGSSYPGVREGDVICVLLGHIFPVLLRTMHEGQANMKYELVGNCRVPGIMNGEMIYRKKLPANYRPVITDRTQDLIDSRKVGLLDTNTNELTTDPAKVLEQTGIKVESYQREPHVLEVLPETLKAAGIMLEDFTIV